MIRAVKKAISAIGEWIDPIGHSGYDPNDSEKVKRNLDGTMHIHHIRYTVFDVELECGHRVEICSTGWLSGSVDCLQCEKSE